MFPTQYNGKPQQHHQGLSSEEAFSRKKVRHDWDWNHLWRFYITGN
jgi:hypothetical protein